MSKSMFLMQALTDTHHKHAISELIDPNATLNILSSAYLTEAGVKGIAESLKASSHNTALYIGVRNGVTSYQGLTELIKLGIKPFVIDTGTPRKIFHPKIYFSLNDNRAIALIGSANLTNGGLSSNIEASVSLELYSKNKDDKKFISDLTSCFNSLKENYPKNVFQVSTLEEVEALLLDECLIDENIPTNFPKPPNKRRDGTPIQKMELYSCSMPSIGLTKKNNKVEEESSNNEIHESPSSKYPIFIWESKPLTERDLSIPKSEKTNPTGSMGWKKGTHKTIDHRHFFRDEVFNELEWRADPNNKNVERTSGEFELIIDGINYGIYNLSMSHKTDKSSASYLQKNFMTQLHWGNARKHVSNIDLLGKTLFLYRNSSSREKFIIKIE